MLTFHRNTMMSIVDKITWMLCAQGTFMMTVLLLAGQRMERNCIRARSPMLGLVYGLSWISPPHIRYKKQFVLPGVIIPGPNNPQHLDSFVFPCLHHVGALQNGDLKVWDAHHKVLSRKTPYVLYGTADSVAAANVNGWVGHHGKKGCRYTCGMNGQHKPRTPHYFPVFLRLCP